MTDGGTRAGQRYAGKLLDDGSIWERTPAGAVTRVDHGATQNWPQIAPAKPLDQASDPANGEDDSGDA